MQERVLKGAQANIQRTYLEILVYSLHQNKYDDFVWGKGL